MADRVRLGNATLTRVVELRFDMRTALFAETPPQAWTGNADLLEPHFWDRDANQWHIAIQSWVVEVDGLTVLVDAAEAAVARRRVFTEASRRRASVIPAHYPGHGGATLVARGDRFAVDDWLDLEPI